MNDDHKDVAGEGEDDAHGEPFEEELPGLAEVQRLQHGRLRPGGVVVLLRQRLPSGAELGVERGSVIIITGSEDAACGEGGEVEDEEEDRVGDVHVCLHALCHPVLHPREGGVGAGARVLSGCVHRTTV